MSIKLKTGFLTRIELTLWFLLMAIWSIFSAKIPSRIVLYYLEGEKKLIDGKIDRLHE